MRKTKIVCTLGPATDDEFIIRELIKNGMDTARINMSHDTHDVQKKRIDLVKKIRRELKKPVAILLDTKGPEIRTGIFKKPVYLTPGKFIRLTTDDITGDETVCPINYKDLYNDIYKNCRILINDGLIELCVKEVSYTGAVCEIISGGTISSRKGVNIPGVKLSLPFINEQDRLDLALAVSQEVDFVAASFTRTADDINDMRYELEKNGGDKIKIIAKIENMDGVNNIDQIIRVSDGIMVARGDLGVEVPLEDIPVIQKKLIEKAYNSGKHVITATQMLDSMINNPRPTRAESTDVANAIYDGTSAIMLSGETAAGKYPVEAVKTMATIAQRTENDINYIKRLNQRSFDSKEEITSAISHATCTTAHDLNASAVIAVSKTGYTARMVAKYRPRCPIICCTTDQKIYYQINMTWGVTPLLVEEKSNTDALFAHVIEESEKACLIKNGDLVVITAGVPLGVSGTTNLIKVHLTGNIIAKGEAINEYKASGNLCVCSSELDAQNNFLNDDILVINETSNNILALMKRAKGIITEKSGVTSHAAIVGLTLDKPVIVGVKNATKLLKSGTTVTIDSKKGIIYSGK